MFESLVEIEIERCYHCINIYDNDSMLFQQIHEFRDKQVFLPLFVNCEVIFLVT